MRVFPADRINIFPSPEELSEKSDFLIGRGVVVYG
jgi:hypothetical protein